MASAVTDEIVSLLRALVRRLAEMPPLAETAATLARRLEIGVPEGGWEPFLRSVADAVGGVVTALEAQRRELEDFLERVTQQLAEFEQWTHWRAGAAQSRRDDTLGLELTMQAEMVHLNQEVVRVAGSRVPEDAGAGAARQRRAAAHRVSPQGRTRQAEDERARERAQRTRSRSSGAAPKSWSSSARSKRRGS